MRIITLNANGIRSAAGKGLFDWFKRQLFGQKSERRIEIGCHQRAA